MAAFSDDATVEWYYLGDDSKNMGPFTISELSLFFRDEVIKSLTFVWNEDMDGWKTIEDYPELQNFLNTTTEAYGLAASGGGGGESKAAAASRPVAADKIKAGKSMARRLSVNRMGTSRNSAPPKVDSLDDLSKLKMLSQKCYVDQAQWFLNAYWTADEITFKDNPSEAEKVWQWTRYLEKLDKKLGKDGNELDEFDAHIFLEKNLGALTVKKMRQVLADIDVDFNKKVSLVEFLIYQYRVDYKYLVNAVVDDKETEALINAAKEKLAEAQHALEDAKAKAEEAVAAAAAARAAANLARQEAEAAAVKEQKAIEEEKKAKAAADDFAQAEVAAKEALAVLEAEQKAYNDLCGALEAKSKDMNLGMVKRNKAANELAQLKTKDPLPLNRAKINQGAAVRRVGKARKKADKAAQDAAAAAAAASAARKTAEDAAAAAKVAADAAEVAAQEAADAVLVADKAVEEAADIMEDTKQKCMNNTTEGTFWWMDRDWEESKKYMSSAQIARLEAKRNNNKK